MHMMSRSDFIHEEQETARKSKEICTNISAKGSITTTEQATVNVRDSDMLITVQLLKDSPAVLSQGKIDAKTTDILMNGRNNRPH